MRRNFTAPVPNTVRELFSTSIVAAARAASSKVSAPTGYSQRQDKTLSPFIKGNNEVAGQAGMEKQYAGVKPMESQVRVQPLTEPKSRPTTTGQGLHEPFPTDMRGEIAAITQPTRRRNAAQIQAGSRTSPSLTPMRVFDSNGQPTGETSGHTGTYMPPKNSRKYRDQKSAHDRLRAMARETMKGRHSGAEMLSKTLATQLDVIPTGPELLRDKNITGFRPNLKGFGTFAKPAQTLKAAAGSERFKYAEIAHQRREATKDRLRSYNAAVKLAKPNAKVRDPSPKRHSLARGGGYMSNPPAVVAAKPSVSGRFPLAQTAAALTEPLRLEPEGKSLTKK